MIASFWSHCHIAFRKGDPLQALPPSLIAGDLISIKSIQMLRYQVRMAPLAVPDHFWVSRGTWGARNASGWEAGPPWGAGPLAPPGGRQGPGREAGP